MVAFCAAQHPYFYTITDDNGLPSNEVYDLAQDKDGFMWIGCNAGLYRYDGTDFISFKNAQHSGKAISHITFDNKGRLWCQNFTSQIFSVNTDTLKLEYDWSKRIKNYPFFCFDDSACTWLTADSGLCKVKNGKVLQSVNSASILSIPGSSVFADIHCFNGRLYFSEKKALGVVDQQGIKFFTNTNRPDRFADALLMSSFHMVDQRLLLLSRTEKQNSLWEVKNDSLLWLIDLPSSLGRVFALRNDNKGKLWIGSSNGALCLDYNLHALFGGQLFFPGKSVSDIVLDKEGNYWFSTLQDGIFVVPSTDVWIYTAANSPLADTRIKQLAKDEKDNLYIGYQTGKVSRYSFQTKQMATLTLQNTPTEIQAMEYNPAKQQLIVGQNKTWIIETGGSMQATHAQGISNVKSLAWLSGDSYLIGSVINAAIVSIKPRVDTLNTFRSKRTRVVFANKQHDELWMGHTDGLWLSTNGTLEEKTFNGHTVSATDIAQTANGIVWVSTLTDGVLGFNKGVFATQLNKEIGISNGFVRKMGVVGNTLWMVTEDNLVGYNVVTKAIKRYNRFDGLPSNEITDIEFLNGKILLATPKGIVEIPENFNSVNLVPPSIFISAFAVHERDTALVAAYNLPYYNNNIRISFKGIAFRSHGEFTYKYRMLGLDTGWIITNSKSNFARYPSLPAGSYVFEVKALNEDGVESTEAAHLNIIIRAPFWQRWWFFMLCVIAIAGLVSAFFAWRIRSLRRKNELEKRMIASQLSTLKAQMNPHFMFNALNSIQDLVLQQDTANAQLYLGKFSELTRVVLDASGAEFITLHKEEEMLALYLDLEKLRFGDELHYKIEVSGGIDKDEVRLPSMIVQPFVENALKHGLLHKQGSKQLNVLFEQRAQQLVCIIEDNGIGRKASAEINARKKKHKSFATDATTERLRLLRDYYNLKIDLQIIDLPQGTRVMLTIPL
ncbi:MAG TPA: histidine kinase [Chitinophagales bacterium]|nr:histidine kinase [Chitinophagales bacterium]